MASLTIRNLRDETKKRLRLRAAENGRSVEAEARDLLDHAVAASPHPEPKTGLDLVKGLMEVTKKYGGFQLDFPERGPIRGIPPFRSKSRRKT